MAVQQADSPAVTGVPRLETGDHLTRAEFERRYEAMPDLKKAELIEGVVYVGSPVRHTVHGRPSAVLITWLGIYALNTPGVDLSENATVRLDLENEPQPDALLRIDEPAGGQSRIRDDYVEGAPELLVEVSASSASIDLHAKLRAYRRNGVREYIVWRVEERLLDWFSLDEGQFRPLVPDTRGVVSSGVFPALRLLMPALLQGNYPAVLAEQQAALGTPAHQRFIEQLASRQLSGQERS